MSELDSIVGEDVNLTPESAEPEQIQEQPAEQVTQETTAEQAETETVEEVRAKTVPLAALHEAREKIRIQREEFTQFKAEQARREQIIEQRLAALVQAQQPQAPAFDENPAEHLRQQLQTVQQSQQATAEQIQQWHQAQQAEAQRQQLAQRVAAVEAEFVQQAPDYEQALKHLASVRVRELVAFGNDEESARRQSVQELHQHAYWCAANGKNPAAIAYELAKARGYSSKPAAPSVADNFKVQQKGVAASRSLGSGGAASGKPSVEALLSMTDEDFAAATKGNNWHKLMGG